MSSEPANALVTIADVTELVAERDRVAAQLAGLNRRVEAIRQFLGDKRFDEITGKKPQKGPRSFREVMQSALENAPHGLTYEELREELRDGGLGEALERSPNNFFNTISRLQRLKLAEKVGDRLVATRFIDAMPEEVRAALESETGGQTSAPTAVMNVLASASAPMTPAQVVEALSREAPGINAQRIYAALSRLTTGGNLVRTEDGRYRRPGTKWSEANLFETNE